MPGFGRLYAPDPRDYPLSARLATVPPSTRSHRYWNAEGWWGDQDGTSQCVAFAWTHWVEDGPVTHEGRPPILDPGDLYDEAQRVDEWPGEDYDGTSVRAGAKVLKMLDLISEYRFASSVGEVVKTLLELGPVVAGTAWVQGMMEPDAEGFVEVTGSSVGGHAYKLDGVNVKRGVLRLKNSWGQGWGRRGHAFIAIEDFEKLLRQDGEACLATEVGGRRLPPSP